MSKLGVESSEIINGSHRKVAPKSGVNNEEVIHWAQQSCFLGEDTRDALDWGYKQQKQSGFKNRVNKGFTTTVDQTVADNRRKPHK